METIIYKDTEFQLRNKINELTLEEFSKILNIINFNKDESIYDKYMKIFNILNMPQDISDALDIDSFFKIVNSFDFNTELEIQSEIELNGIKFYTNNGESFKLTIKKLKELSLLFFDFIDHPLLYVILADNIYNSKEEIDKDNKFELICNANAEIIVPLLNYISENLSKYLEMKTN